jgi:predicted amidohydrolase
MKLGIAQTRACQTAEDSLYKAKGMLKQAASQQIDLLVFPEMFMAAPDRQEDILQIAEPMEGNFVHELCLLAREASLSLGAGVWEKVPGQERVYNSYVLINAQGSIQAVYRKLHLFDALNVQESRLMIPGSELPAVLQVQDFALASVICYDLRFPELFRSLALQGAQLILVPAAWYSGPLKEEHWQALLQARAIENTVFIAGAGLMGASFCGRSCVVDPYGVLCLQAGEEEQLLSTTLSLQRLGQVRQKLPTLQHVRSDVLK